ncbi:alpha/beta hydrolase [Enterovirga sp.]|uniref:RBBP9/YdeN family alpha/beta hydrolase n=1 Tax=Enterovirga sp. TaxID=2026350 RepID=UPI002C88DE9C|nr:alpha/beta hydrolase [Enterovirga sp.]HMO29906.1 alpha/beta hydrolase [Enterovirga sp.]
MRTSDSDLILVPGLGGPDPEHWQSRWGGRLATARHVRQRDWHAPDPAEWTSEIAAAVAAATRPAVILAHGLGTVATVLATPSFPAGIVRGAFLVAPVDVERPDMEGPLGAFSPLPRGPLPFPSLLVASRSDPRCDFARAGELAGAWGSVLVDAGEAGSLDGESGHGPWPEGLMRLAGFLKGL